MSAKDKLAALFDKVDRKLVTSDVIPQDITKWIWDEKYRWRDRDGDPLEDTVLDTHKRVVRGVYANDKLANDYAPTAYRLMANQIWSPGGRIHAGAGTDKRVTIINCYVSPEIQDSMSTETALAGLGIMDALQVAALTQQMGGGIGMDFSPLRPYGSLVYRTHSTSSGPLPFMHMWDAMCATVKSSGHRRGAMMGVMRCDHPDVLSFIREKRTKGHLENFNISVLVTNAFMRALENDEMWDLGFNVPRADGNHVEVISPDKEGDKPFYVYERFPAREMWDEMIGNTYEYAEPGIIFIDRVNERNNLWYCETISATNPCGEQPLPPNGDCNLGAINLAALVHDPFVDPHFEDAMLEEATRAGMRFLDNVLDIALFPTEAQREEAIAKRRTGLGITGLGNMLQMMKLRYGSPESLEFTEDIMRKIAIAAYDESVELARERGPFPLFDADRFCESYFVKKLPEWLQQKIRKYGIRNGVLLTIAPTGTTSMYYGNISSGIEPTFAWHYERKIRQADGSLRTFGDVYDYGYLKFKELGLYDEGNVMPDYMITALELPVDAHLKMQAVCQKWIDASISKTINCPPEMEYDDFKDVYRQAWEGNCKGCTTYRPSDVRGSVLSVKGADEKSNLTAIQVAPRPDVLEGFSYKAKWPGIDAAFYITINDHYVDGVRLPFEIFINTKSVKHQEWITALTRMISAIFRRGGDVTFILEELQQVHSAQGGAWMGGKYVPSLVALIGQIIERHFGTIGLIEVQQDENKQEDRTKVLNELPDGEICPSCSAPTLTMQEGCKKCGSCGYSAC